MFALSMGFLWIAVDHIVEDGGGIVRDCVCVICLRFHVYLQFIVVVIPHALMKR